MHAERLVELFPQSFWGWISPNNTWNKRCRWYNTEGTRGPTVIWRIPLCMHIICLICGCIAWLPTTASPDVGVIILALCLWPPSCRRRSWIWMRCNTWLLVISRVFSFVVGYLSCESSRWLLICDQNSSIMLCVIYLTVFWLCLSDFSQCS